MLIYCTNYDYLIFWLVQFISTSKPSPTIFVGLTMQDKFGQLDFTITFKSWIGT